MYTVHDIVTLELVPGEYDTTEGVGPLVIANFINFTLKGSSYGNTTITCRLSKKFGFMFYQMYLYK